MTQPQKQDLTSQINLITSRLSEKLETLETEFQRWNDYKTDYDALETQLKTLPDNTTRTAMIPLGKLAFMPGKLIHTNEILVLLGDQYYAERSAKQAIEILGRRREVVKENLELVEAQLNSFKQKTNTIMDSTSLLSNADPQINEEGLPIMEIREELPLNYDQEQAKKKSQAAKAVVKTTSDELPESVLRAREMMKEADEKINKNKEDAENKALFDLLRELEEGEEEEEESDVVSVAMDALKHNDDDEEEEYEEDFSDDDDRYDTEISENMFDRFGDDEEYPLDGVVDQEDFTCYDQQVQPASATIKEIVNDDNGEYCERSTPKVITKRKEKKPVVVEVEKKRSVTENTSTTTPDKPKKFSKFKLLRQQQKEDGSRKKPVEPVQTKVIEKQPIRPAEGEEEEDIMLIEPKKKSVLAVENNGIPKVAYKPKKMSRFKLSRQLSEAPPPPPPVLTEEERRIKPKRTVTWDTNTSVRDHDGTLAPSVVSKTTSYSQPIKTVDIFYKTEADDYPSLDDASDSGEQKVDLNELIKVARDAQEAFWRPKDGSEALIPIIADHQEEEEEEEGEGGMIIARKSKLDNKIMKGAVMERDIVPVDMEQVEEDMDIREITSNYQQMRQNMLASTGGFSFATKPEFEVFDEELPLPKKKGQEEEEEEEEEAPRKMSRFKAARLGMRMTEDQ